MMLEKDIRDEDWLIEQMRQLIAACGPERFLESPLVMPTREFFPDGPLPAEEGVYVLLSRLMDYAGVGDMEVAVELVNFVPIAVSSGPKLPASGGTGASTTELTVGARYLGSEGGVCRFQCGLSSLDDQAALLGTLSHEIGHAFREIRGVAQEPAPLEEVLTDVTGIYLGFGVLLCNSAYRFTSGGELRTLRTCHSRAGYLPVVSLCFLLAAQAVCRGMSLVEAWQVGQALGSNQRGYFLEFHKDLWQAEEEVRCALLPSSM
jgi:hypothetical protein